MLGQPPFDAESRERRHEGEPRAARGRSAAPAARSTLDVHTRGVDVAARSRRARRHYRRSSPGKTGALPRALHIGGSVTGGLSCKRNLRQLSDRHEHRVAQSVKGPSR